MEPFRCVECGEVKISIPHNDWGRTCFGIEKTVVGNFKEEEKLPEFKTSPLPPIPVAPNPPVQNVTPALPS